MSATLHIEMINLARAPERRDRMRAELAAAGVEAQFHPAFDARENGRDVMLSHCRPEGPWGPFEEGNMAITISHAQVWERFLASDASHCVVMEDDVFISPDLGAWLNDLSWWPEDADMVKIERWRARTLKVLLSAKGRMHRGRHIKRLLSRHVGAAGYILTRQAAEQFLAQRPFNITIDNLLFNFNASPAARRMAVYQVTPALTEQGNEPPQPARNIPQRDRPKGLALWRQKLKRGWYEVAYPLPTIAQLLTKRALLQPVPFAAQVSQKEAL